MKDTSYVRLLALVLSATAVTFAFTGCAESATQPQTSTESSAPDAQTTPSEATESEESESSEEASALRELEVRAISASDSELLVRTADGEYTFQIREEDVRAIDPGHIQSHANVPSIAFRIFVREIDGVDYVVSVEEIDGSELSFD